MLLPGVQILVAFLLTVPFVAGFEHTDATEHDFYGVALGAGVLSVISFVAPTAFHRVGPRKSRSVRLVWGIRLLRIGLALLGISLTTAVAVVALVVFGRSAAAVASLAAAGAMVGLWVLLPIGTGRPVDPL